MPINAEVDLYAFTRRS